MLSVNPTEYKPLIENFGLDLDAVIGKEAGEEAQKEAQEQAEKEAKEQAEQIAKKQAEDEALAQAQKGAEEEAEKEAQIEAEKEAETQAAKEAQKEAEKQAEAKAINQAKEMGIRETEKEEIKETIVNAEKNVGKKLSRRALVVGLVAAGITAAGALAFLSKAESEVNAKDNSTWTLTSISTPQAGQGIIQLQYQTPPKLNKAGYSSSEEINPPASASEPELSKSEAPSENDITLCPGDEVIVSNSGITWLDGKTTYVTKVLTKGNVLVSIVSPSDSSKFKSSLASSGYKILSSPVTKKGTFKVNADLGNQSKCNLNKTANALQSAIDSAGNFLTNNPLSQLLSKIFPNFLDFLKKYEWIGFLILGIIVFIILIPIFIALFKLIMWIKSIV